ncbi:MAG TPA: hypothetical protein VJ654_02655 [Noviherbaspirillum sp.]|nr:hypothetical protein [Noviherbaspirillum sp.]
MSTLQQKSEVSICMKAFAIMKTAWNAIAVGMNTKPVEIAMEEDAMEGGAAAMTMMISACFINRRIREITLQQFAARFIPKWARQK